MNEKEQKKMEQKICYVNRNVTRSIMSILLIFSFYTRRRISIHDKRNSWNSRVDITELKTTNIGDTQLTQSPSEYSCMKTYIWLQDFVIDMCIRAFVYGGPPKTDKLTSTIQCTQENRWNN